MIDFVSGKVYVLDAKIGSVIEKPGFWRASPACTAAVDGPGPEAGAEPGLDDRAGSGALVVSIQDPWPCVCGGVVARSVVAFPRFFQ
jgi:hypothetical protein